MDCKRISPFYFVDIFMQHNRLASVCNWANQAENPMNLRVQFGWIFLDFCVIHLAKVSSLCVQCAVHLIVIAIFARRLNAKLCIISLAFKFPPKCKRQTSDKKEIHMHMGISFAACISKCTLTIAAAIAERGRRVHTI